MPAASEATPVAKGLTVEASTPEPAPRKTIAKPVMRSKPRPSASGTSRTKNPSDSSAIPSVLPASANTDISTTISSEGLWRKRSSSRPMPAWIAPVFIVTLMNAPIASTNRKICAAP